MLEARDLCCIRDDRVLFQSLSFSVKAGQILQVEGPNGAGKTSLLRILAGLARPQDGNVFWRGSDIARDREAYLEELLFLGHKSGVKAELSALENLAYFKQMLRSEADYSLWQLLAKVGLAGFEDIPAGQLSAGQHRRVALARLWLHDTPMWILDEPFTSLDKKGVAGLELRFKQHLGKGGSIIVTTHQDLVMSGVEVNKLTLSGVPELAELQ